MLGSLGRGELPQDGEANSRARACGGRTGPGAGGGAGAGADRSWESPHCRAVGATERAWAQPVIAQARERSPWPSCGVAGWARAPAAGSAPGGRRAARARASQP